jgi:hypothetical protein
MILEEDEQWADNGEIIKIPSQGKKHGWEMISKQEVGHNGNPQLRPSWFGLGRKTEVLMIHLEPNWN